MTNETKREFWITYARGYAHASTALNEFTQGYILLSLSFSLFSSQLEIPSGRDIIE